MGKHIRNNQRLTASTNPQLATGPQKCVVLGPVGELTNCMRRDDAILFCAFVFWTAIRVECVRCDCA
jgi:hypothetical protein